jgi:DNA-binding SARP family transcriptional activator/LysM repeat protein
MRRFARLVKRLIATTLFLGFFGVIIAGLVLVVGWPLPHHWPTKGEWIAWVDNDRPLISTRFLIDVFACVVWAFLGGLFVMIVRDTVRRLRHRGLPRLRVPVHRQGFIGGLVSAFLLGTGRAAAAHTGGDAATPAGHDAAAAAAATPVADTHELTGQHSYTVQPGDTLWDIAQDQTGNPLRYKQLAADNHGRTEPDGRRFSDPDLIYPGWQLAIPDSDTDQPATPSERHSPTHPPNSHAAPAPSTATPGRPATAPSPPSATPHEAGQRSHATGPGHHGDRSAERSGGVRLPSGTWISTGLAVAIAGVAAMLRLQRRRRARLAFPIPTGTGPQPSPVPDSLAAAETAGTSDLTGSEDSAPAVPMAVGADAHGEPVSLFDLPGPGIALIGQGAESAARAVLAAALATGTPGPSHVRPLMVTTAGLLARLLPPGTTPAGLDPEATSFDAERLLVLADTAAAVTHAEEEMIARRRLLDNLDATTVEALNARADHAEHQPPYLLLVDTGSDLAARLAAIGAHRDALHLHPVILGALDGIPTLQVARDGATDLIDANGQRSPGRLSTLTATELADALAMLAQAMPRPEPGTDLDQPAPAPALAEPAGELIPESTHDVLAPARLQVLGAVTLATTAGPVTKGMRSGSYAVLALLAAHPDGRTLDQLAGNIYPGVAPRAALNRVRADITTARRVIRTATGLPDAGVILYDPPTGRYRLDPDTLSVDLWQMLAAIRRANTADTDSAALAALRQAVEAYRGEFADGCDRAWATDYAATYRHQILSAYARIAELLETDQPDAAVAALETATDLDPVNEELYQRILRIHGRQHRPDAVRRTLRRLEDRLADLDAEPSEATRLLAERQLRSAVPAAALSRRS